MKSIDTKYLLSEGYGASLVERLNQMAAENDGIPRMSVECKIALLVGIMDPGSAIVNSWADVDTWFDGEFEFSMGDSSHMCGKIEMSKLYWLFPSKDSVLVRTAAEWRTNLDQYNYDVYVTNDSLRSMMKDSIQIVPFAITETDDISVLRFTTSRWHGSPPGGMAIWKVHITKSGFILSIENEYFFSDWYPPIPDL
jgi:hypothetical protein